VTIQPVAGGVIENRIVQVDGIVSGAVEQLAARTTDP